MGLIGRLLENRVKALQKAKPLTTDAAILETSIIEVRMLTEQLLCVIKHIGIYDEAISKIFPVHPDAEIFASLPGAGTVLAPHLLAAFGSDRDRFTSPKEVQNYSGIAPVTVQSGKNGWFVGGGLAPSLYVKVFMSLRENRGNTAHPVNAYL